ncbi:hypothetical protein [Pseudohongiella sp.]|uniref:Uncharacterized protein n=1 Tax=marine sediment metagenome TaxID=412755 RepID=A0A0F9W3Q0_9ZZZZ|nr:hypothetical protein [Pseudohongiella sp.]HDZ10053.1 hypothetical protein [Pseudohongiella sp.]HEA63402.1 hypothetical protein [Pseudohongiella sp.]
MQSLMQSLTFAQWLDLAVLLVTGLLVLFGFWLMAGAQQDDSQPDLHYLAEIDDFRGNAAVEHWANVFVLNNVPRRFGLSFAQFMTNPRGYLQVLFFYPAKDVPEVRPLLPAQVVVYERLLREELEAEELQQLQDRELAALESRYQTISNSGGRITSSMATRKQPRKWQTRGTHLKHA